MKITVFNGSPWGKEGVTHLVVQHFLLGAHKFNVKFHHVELAQKNIHNCIGCGNCFYKTPGRCVFDDDMTGLIKRFLHSDYVIFATPVYMDNITGVMKNFIDRLMPVFEPHYHKENSHIKRGVRYKNIPRFLIMSTASLPEKESFEVVSLFFRKFADSLNTQVAGELFAADAGLLMLNEDLRIKSSIERFKEKIKAAGSEFLTTGVLSRETTDDVLTPILEREKFMKYANEIWDQILPEEKAKV